MNDLIIIVLSGIAVYLLLLPIVGWCRKVKKEMEEAERDDRTE